MKILFIVIILLYIATTAYSLTGRVIKVIDGDTITVLKNSKTNIKIRLYGIDAPEKKQPFGQQARKVLARMIAGKTVEIEETGKDRYGRFVGIVQNAGRNINSQLVKDGFAWVYPAFCKRPECSSWKSQEAEAKAARRGLWRDKQPIPPWKWRKRKK